MVTSSCGTGYHILHIIIFFTSSQHVGAPFLIRVFIAECIYECAKLRFRIQTATTTIMARPSIPQDIIDKIVGMIDTSDKPLLKTCAQVSTSFAYPSIKRFYEAIALSTPETCRNLLHILTKHPPDLDIQSYIKTLQILYPRALGVPGFDYKSNHHPEPEIDAFEDKLLPVLRLLSHSQALESLEFHVCLLPFEDAFEDAYGWRQFSGNLRRTLSDMIHSPYLTDSHLPHYRKR
jgi:hypothetical protein